MERDEFTQEEQRVINAGREFTHALSLFFYSMSARSAVEKCGRFESHIDSEKKPKLKF
jgi:hypothetical protein